MLREENATATVERDIPGLGSVLGVRQDDITIFHGIPFARAPTGEDRFEAPIAVQAWAGVLDATRPAAIAPQRPSRVYDSMGAIDTLQSEDCLSLTLWLPDTVDRAAPVIVWFHGGGFSTGGGAIPWYDASSFARRGFVVASVNYRLGALGFLAVPDRLPGNLALLDQETALRWLQCHVGAFGGDPRKVTVMGQSGGAHNIASLLTMPRAIGLFSRAILMSPPLGIGLQPVEEANRHGDYFIEALGLKADASDLFISLKEASVQDLLDAQLKSAVALGAMHKGNLSPPFRPTTLDPHIIAQDQLIPSSARAAAAHGVDILIGWTREEAALFYLGNPMIADMTDKLLAEHAEFLFGVGAESALKDVQRRRPDARPGRHFIDLVTDTTFRLPALEMADQIFQAGGRVFTYAFDWQSPCADLGACHCLDLPFVFGTRRAWEDAPMMRGADATVADRLCDEVIERWSGFADRGDPGFAPWSEHRRPIMHFDSTSWLQPC